MREKPLHFESYADFRSYYEMVLTKIGVKEKGMHIFDAQDWARGKSEKEAEQIWKKMMSGVGQKLLEQQGYVEVIYSPPLKFRRKPLPKGRPKKEETLEHSIHVRLDDELMGILNHFCRTNNCDQSQAIRKAIRLLGLHPRRY